jgi:thioredoxin
MAIVTCGGCGARNRVDEGRAASQQPVCGRCGAALEASAASSAPSEPVEVTDATFNDLLRSAGSKPVLVDLWAPWCPPCRALAPVIHALAAEAGGRYVIAKLNTQENPSIPQQFGIQGIPTLLIFKNGALVDQLVGLQPREAIEAKLASLA